MDKDGLLLFRSKDSDIVGLKFWHGPGQGLRLLLQDTNYSNQVGGILGKSLIVHKKPRCLLFLSFGLKTLSFSLRSVLPECGLGAPGRGK